MKSVAIIGAGITGLTAAFYLKRRGLAVTVYESSGRVGGVIQSLRQNGFLAEFTGSVVFFFVIAQTALDKRGIATTPFPALPIGLILVAVHVCLIPLTGCGVNPARTFGPSMVGCMESKDVCDQVVQSSYWIYYAGPFLASFFVAELTNLMAWEPDGEVEKEHKSVSSPDGEEAKEDISTHDVKPVNTFEGEDDFA